MLVYFLVFFFSLSCTITSSYPTTVSVRFLCLCLILFSLLLYFEPVCLSPLYVQVYFLHLPSHFHWFLFFLSMAVSSSLSGQHCLQYTLESSMYVPVLPTLTEHKRHFTLSHHVQPHLTLDHVNSPYPMLHHLTLCYFVSPHLVQPYLTSPCFIQPLHLMSPPITSCYLT